MQNAYRSRRHNYLGALIKRLWKNRRLYVTNLLVFGDWEQKLRVQFSIVLGQGLMAIVIDELHHREEGKRLGEAVPPLSVVNLY